MGLDRHHVGGSRMFIDAYFQDQLRRRLFLIVQEGSLRSETKTPSAGNEVRLKLLALVPLVWWPLG